MQQAYSSQKTGRPLLFLSCVLTISKMFPVKPRDISNYNQVCVRFILSSVNHAICPFCMSKHCVGLRGESKSDF